MFVKLRLCGGIGINVESWIKKLGYEIEILSAFTVFYVIV
jgi:hypothetical protein